jgi:hypothetical protein
MSDYLRRSLARAAGDGDIDAVILARAEILARHASNLLWEAGRHLRTPRWNVMGNPLHDETRRINYELCRASDATEKLSNDLADLIRSLTASPPASSSSSEGPRT